jgi:hypothetical protein
MTMSGASDPTPDSAITFGRFAAVFIPFSFLLSAALLVPETEQRLVHGRVIYTIWTTILFMIPALWLQLSGATAHGARAYWRLCWTAGLLAYGVHFYFTVGVIFHGSLREVYAAQKPIIATSNLLDSAWWTFDVVLAWSVRSERRWISLQRLAVHLYVAATFFVSAVLIKHGVVKGLGVVMTAATVAGGVVGLARHFAGRARRPAGSAGDRAGNGLVRA